MYSRITMTTLLLIGSICLVAGCQPEPVVYDPSPDCWPKSAIATDLHLLGAQLYAQCRECHSLDGSADIAPSWKGLWDRVKAGDVEFTDGTTLVELMGPDELYFGPEDYIQQSIIKPKRSVHAGYDAIMPTFQGQLDDLEIMAIIEFMRNLDKFDQQGKLLPEGE